MYLWDEVLKVVGLKKKKNETASRMGLFGNSRELQFGTSLLWQKPTDSSPANKGEEGCFVEKKETWERVL